MKLRKVQMTEEQMSVIHQALKEHATTNKDTRPGYVEEVENLVAMSHPDSGSAEYESWVL